MSQRCVYKIILLGSTGVGKSTFINSIANYLTYFTFKEALANKPICLIPTKFNVTLTNLGLEEITITQNSCNGEDENEQHSILSRSSTCYPRTYIFAKDNVEFHIIDVPGYNDTGGTEQDKKNKAAILQKIKELDVLHGIVIVINASNPRLTMDLQNTYNEIFMELHRDAVPNIMFVLTYSPTGPGNAITPLRDYLAVLNKRGLNVEIGSQTIFSLTNDGFRYQCGVLNEKYKAEMAKNEAYFKNCWEDGRQTILRLLQVVSHLTGHQVDQSVSVSKARIIIKSIMGPLAKVFSKIMSDMSEEKKQAQIESLMKTGNLIKKEVKVETLKLPQAVCLECAGKKAQASKSDIKIDNQICHNVCRLNGGTVDKVGDEMLKYCAIFDSDGKCKKCSCSFKCHVRITSKTLETLQAQQAKPALTKEQAEVQYAKLRQTLYNEQGQIWTTIMDLMTFIRANAIVDFNANFGEKLKTEIEHKEGLNADPQVISQLRKKLDSFQKEFNFIQTLLENKQQNVIPAENIEDLLEELFDLQIYGRLIKNLYDHEYAETEASQMRENIYYQITYSPLDN